jgi:hypothetical protein
MGHTIRQTSWQVNFSTIGPSQKKWRQLVQGVDRLIRRDVGEFF